jgi:dUTP pyrophosphatase
VEVLMKVTIKRIDPTLPLPEYATEGSCAFDLYSRETISIESHQIYLIPSNLIIATPPGFVLIVTPRSSLARKKGLVMPNSVGVIDQDFAGESDETLIQVQNISSEPVTIERGERIAQGLFLKMERAVWQEVDQTSKPDRGGIGSTGGYV